MPHSPVTIAPPRRRHLQSLAALTGASLLPATARAQSFPSRSIKIVVPHAPGGNSDAFGRILAQRLSERIGQPVVVENRTGAGGTIACASVARSAPDGYTIVVADTGTHAIAPQLYGSRLQYDVFRDFTPISLAASFPTVLLVHPSVPARTPQEFVALVKSQPGKLTYSSAGTGNGSHLAQDVFRYAAGGLDMIHVPYKGGSLALNDVVSGQISMMFSSQLQAQPFTSSGRLRMIGVTTARRSPATPDVPTLSESGVPGYDIAGWYGLAAPGATPPAIIDKLQQEIAKILKMPDVKEKLAQDGSEAVGSTPAQFKEHIRTEVDKWRALIQTAGITG